MKYKYCFVDTQIYLTTAFHAIKPHVPIDQLASSLVKSFLGSMMNLQNELDFEKLILLHDTYPYFKTRFLSDYKGDRTYVTQEMVDSMEEGEDKDKAQLEADALKQRALAKRIIQSLGEIGIPSIYQRGFEADDLAYICSKFCSNNGFSSILCSWDTDWMYWCTENSDWYSKKRGLLTYSDIMVEYKDTIPKELSLFEYKRYYDSFYGSHNHLHNTVNDDWYDETFKSFYSEFKKKGYSTELFSDPKLSQMQYESLALEEYPDYIKVLEQLESLDFIGRIPSMSEIRSWMEDKEVYFDIDKYIKFLSKLNQSLFA